MPRKGGIRPVYSCLPVAKRCSRSNEIPQVIDLPILSLESERGITRRFVPQCPSALPWAMKIPKGLQPLIDDGMVDSVLRRLKSGKEASVYIDRKSVV